MRKTPLLAAMFILLLAGCTKNDSFKSNNAERQVNEMNGQASKITIRNSAITIRKDGKIYQAEPYLASYITDVNSGKVGQTVFFKDVGNKRTGYDFIPGDPFRGGRTNITYAVDNEHTTDNGLTLTQVTTAIDNAMETWDAVKCSDLNMTKVAFQGNLGIFSNLLGYGGSTTYVADVEHCGFLPPEFFDLFALNGRQFILAITIPFIWVIDGIPTDYDHNGLLDLAFAETYYNDGFDWSTSGDNGIDIETVALHESGHGLAQDHFGKAFATNANGKIHFAPRSVMNAGYSGVQRSLQGSDIGGHCSIWANWPNK